MQPDWLDTQTVLRLRPGMTALELAERFDAAFWCPELGTYALALDGDRVVAAAREVKLAVPLVVRMKGTNEDLGKQILKDSGLPIISADNMGDAGKKVVAAITAKAAKKPAKKKPAKKAKKKK